MRTTARPTTPGISSLIRLIAVLALILGSPAKLGDKAKASSDPVYNSVSQLVAFELNQLLNATGTGSAACQAKATDAARLMQRFLTYIDFRRTASNSTYTMPSNKMQVKQIQANLLYLRHRRLQQQHHRWLCRCAGTALPDSGGHQPAATMGRVPTGVHRHVGNRNG